MSKPLLLAFEGIDGTGKSTQCALLSTWLTQRGIKNIVVKEPGATTLGMRLREVLVNRTTGELSAFTETLMFEADRSHTYETLILPALRDATTVIKDRSIFGTLAYQGYAGGVSLEFIRSLTKHATRGRRADWSFLLDLSVDQADRRLRQKHGSTGPDHFEAANSNQKEVVRQGYLSEARANKDWCSVLDASESVEGLAAQISSKVAQLLGIGGSPSQQAK